MVPGRSPQGQGPGGRTVPPLPDGHHLCSGEPTRADPEIPPTPLIEVGGFIGESRNAFRAATPGEIELTWGCPGGVT